jgi:hypothetical protein
MNFELSVFDLVFCPVIEKWVSKDDCHFCNCRDYPGTFICEVIDNRDSRANRNRPGDGHRAWTTEQVICMLQKEETRVKLVKKREKL